MGLTCVIFAVVSEEVFDKERTDSHAHVVVDVGNAIAPAFRLFFLTVKHRIELLLQLLELPV